MSRSRRNTRQLVLTKAAARCRTSRALPVASWHGAGFRLPDVSRVFGDGAVAGKLPGAGDIKDGLACPSVTVRIQSDQPLVRLEIGLEIRQMHVVVSIRQERVAQRTEDTRLIAAEVIGENQVQGRSRLRLVLIVPVRVVPAATAGHLFRGQAEQEEVIL